MENESNTSPITYSDELVSDLHKDARGYRPTESFWSYWNLLMPSEKQGVWDGLCLSVENNISEDLDREALSIRDFEQELVRLQEWGAQSKEQAIAWFVDGLNEDERDPNYICYCLGLPYSMSYLFKQKETA